MKKKNQTEFKQGEWPEEYPYRLRKVSWCMDTSDGAVCGVLPYYNRHMDYKLKGDSCFLKQVLLDWFWTKGGCGEEVCGEICQYFCKCFTVYYKEGEEDFCISYKKDKETKKPIFNADTFRKKWALNADIKETNAMLKKLLKHVKEFYSKILKAHIDSVNRSKRG